MDVERRPADLKSDRPSILCVDVDVVLSQRARFRCDVYSSSPSVGFSPRRRLDRLIGVCEVTDRFLELDGLEAAASSLFPL